MSVPPFLQLPDGAARVTLDTPRGRFAALATSAAVPPGRTVLLVPGFTGSKEDFIAVLAPPAAHGLRVVAIDQRGQFETTGTDDPAAYSVEELARDVLAITTSLGGATHLVGHSFGGLVARRAAIEQPAAVRSLVLLGSGPAGVPPPAADRLRLLEPILTAGGIPAVWQASEALARTEPGYQEPSAQLAAFLHHRFHAGHPVGLTAMAGALLHEPDRTEALRASRVPVLVCYGAADDAWPPETQREMADRLAAAHVVVPGARHSPAAENPAATAAALLDFWRHVETGPGRAD